jgi:hypothetical protein
MKTSPLLLLALACSDPDPAATPDGSVADQALKTNLIVSDHCG